VLHRRRGLAQASPYLPVHPQISSLQTSHWRAYHCLDSPNSSPTPPLRPATSYHSSPGAQLTSRPALSELAPAVCPLVVCPPSAADQPETAARIANLGHPPSPHAIGPSVIERGLHGVSCLLEPLPPREECVQATPASCPPPPVDWPTTSRCVCGRCLDSRRRFEPSRC
jgi:hypothetical protein